MRDPETFEARLATAYRRYADEVTSDVDPMALARTITARPARMPLTWSRLRPLRLVLLLALLTALALTAAALVATQPSPTPAGVSNGWIVFAANPITAGPAGGAGEFRDIYRMHEGAEPHRIIGSPGDGRSQACPGFSPDGSRLAYAESDESDSGGRPDGRIDGYGRHAVTNRVVIVVELGADGEPSAPVLQLEVPFGRGPLPCPEWSPTGSHLAFFSGDMLWVADVASGEWTLFSVDPSESEPDVPDWAFLDLEWSPDGSSVAVGERHVIRLIPIDESEPTMLLVKADTPRTLNWLPDGREMVYSTIDGEIHIVSVESSDDRRLASGVYTTGSGTFAVSPDGLRLAYSTDGIGVVVKDVDGSHQVVLPVGFEGNLLWSPDGQRLLSYGWDYPPDGAVASIVTAAVTPGSEPVVTTFRDLAFEFMSIAHITWQRVGG